MTDQTNHLPQASFLHSFRVQCRVVGALLMREIMTRYGRHNIGFLWLFGEPMLFTMGVTALWSFVGGHHVSAIPITAFAVTGYSSVLVWRNTVSRCMLAITPNLSLMYHRNVRAIDIYLSRILLEVTGASVSFIFLSIILVFLGLMELPVDLLKVLAGWFSLVWFGAALAIMLGSLSEFSELTDKIWHPVSYIMFPLSGAGFMMEWLPPSVRELAMYLPMVNGIELLREGYFGNAERAHYDIGYLVSCNMFLTLMGLSLCRLVSRNVEPE